MCEHQPPCPSADAVDHLAARVVSCHPEQGWSLLCNGVVIFDDVHVPYERCFVLGDPELCNGFYTHTSAVVHMTHQVVTRTTAKTEYILGLLSLLTEAIGIEQFPHVQADVAEVITTLETLRDTVELKSPLRRNVTQDDVGDVAVFLASPLSRCVTGATIYADNGFNLLGASAL